MNLQPLDDRIVVRPSEAEEKTASGLVIPDTAKEKPQQGTVLAVGPGRRSEVTGEILPLGISELRITLRQATMRFRSPEFMLEYFRTWFGPTQATFEALDTIGQETLAAEMLALYGRYNRSGGVPVIAPCDYLEVVAVRA